MKAEELYKKEFGNVAYVPKESVIWLLKNVTVQQERKPDYINLTEQQLTELSQIGGNYIYEGCNEDLHITAMGVLEILKRYEQIKNS